MLTKVVHHHEFTDLLTEAFGNSEDTTGTRFVDFFEKDLSNSRFLKNISLDILKKNVDRVYLNEVRTIRPMKGNPIGKRTYYCFANIMIREHYFTACLYVNKNNQLRLYITKANSWNPTTKKPAGLEPYNDVEHFLSVRKQDSRTYTYEMAALNWVKSGKFGYPSFYDSMCMHISMTAIESEFAKKLSFGEKAVKKKKVGSTTGKSKSYFTVKYDTSGIDWGQLLNNLNSMGTTTT